MSPVPVPLEGPRRYRVEVSLAASWHLNLLSMKFFPIWPWKSQGKKTWGLATTFVEHVWGLVSVPRTAK